MRVMIGGALAAHPLGGGGNVSLFLQYVLGFLRLGWDTYYVEEIEASRCIDDDWKPCAFATSANRRCFSAVVQRYGLEGRAALLCHDADSSAGLTPEAVEDVAATTD